VDSPIAIKEKKPYSLDYRIHRGDDGEIRYLHVETEIEEISGSEGLVIYGSIQDITDQKIARIALQEMANELARSNEELQQFAYIASHDLQEPLRKITAFGDRLSAKYADALDARGQDFIVRMKDAAMRGQGMVDALLAYSRVATRGQVFVGTDLNQVLKDVRSDLEVRIDECQAFLQVDELPTVDADATQMRQLFQNLLSNALKFHEPGQSPQVEVTNSELGPERVQISVKDNGIGFDESFTERIFQPFQRLHTRSEYEGSGIGLAVCRKIVERHGGEISAQSKPGEGAVFKVTLPVKTVGSM